MVILARGEKEFIEYIVHFPDMVILARGEKEFMEYFVYTFLTW
jgi:hypothetical protein